MLFGRLILIQIINTNLFYELVGVTKQTWAYLEGNQEPTNYAVRKTVQN